MSKDMNNINNFLEENDWIICLFIFFIFMMFIGYFIQQYGLKTILMTIWEGK